MKKLSGTLIFIMTPLFLLAQKSYVIKGHISGLNSPAKVYLKYRENDQDHLDSAVFHNGVFELKENLRDIAYATLIMDQDGSGMPDKHASYDYRYLFLAPGTTLLQSKDSLNNAEITGTKVNVDHEKLVVLLAPFEQQRRQLAIEFNETDDKHQDVHAYAAKINAVIKERKKATLNYIKQNPDNYYSLLALAELGGIKPDPEEIGPYFEMLSPTVKNTTAGKELKTLLTAAAHTRIGDTALDFKMKDVNGKNVSLSDFKGKYVLIDFWASWCVPCRAMNPELVKTYQTYKNKKFIVLGVSLDKARASWLKAIVTDHLTWINISELKYWNGEVGKKYGVNSVPANFLIDPAGKIIGRDLYGSALSDKLQKTL